MMRTLRRTVVIALLSGLAACGSAPDALDSKDSISAGLKGATLLGSMVRRPVSQTPDASQVAALRAALEKDRQPIQMISVESLRYANLMAPYGQNGSVQTWASMSYETVAMRDGMVVATRGFGPDLMSAVAPSTAQARSGAGGFHRVYHYLDGADQAQKFAYDCRFAAAGAETVTVLGKSYATRRVDETCTDAAGASFKNSFWFDGSGNLRQSDQMLAPGLSMMHTQRVID